MSHVVPMLEFMHLLHASGVEATYYEAARKPDALWERVAARERDAFLASREAEGRSDHVTGIHVVRRRGKPLAMENTYILFEMKDLSKLSAAARRASARVLYQAYEAPPPEEHVDELPGALVGSFASRKQPQSIVSLLDMVWGGEAYDVARDGVLAEFIQPTETHLIEEYWLDEPFAKAVVLDDESKTVAYNVVEPELSVLEQALLLTLNDRLRDVLVLQPNEGADRNVLLIRNLFELLGSYRYQTDRRTAYKLGYYFARNYLGLGRIEGMMRDPAVEDISCNGPGLPVFVAHSKLQSLRTNISFEEMELNSFTMKLAQKGGKLLSVAQPLVDATLPNGSRLQAVLGHEITSRGSAFTIRKFREDPLTAVDLIRLGTHSLDTMTTLWMAGEMRRSLIVMGATASGKTTTLNAISQFIPPNLKIVSIEDTHEITLQHENWLAAVTREGSSGNSSEKVTMFDLLRAALRQRPDYIIVGEIRGAEGLTLFQAMSTGHTCFSTMHAGSVENAVYRLENPPINVPRVMLSSLDFFVTTGQVDVKGRPARRMLSMTEINGIDPQTRNLRVNEIFRWDAASDAHQSVAPSAVFERARSKGGWTHSRLDEEFDARRRVLDGLVSRNERHFSDVARAVREFYAARDEHGFSAGPLASAAEAPVQRVGIPTPEILKPSAPAQAEAPRRKW